MTTTNANRIDTSSIPTLTGFEIREDCPTGTSTRYLVKAVGGNWQKYNGSAWVDVATQALTPASVMSEGNTAAELNTITSDGMTSFTGKAIDVAVGLQTENDALPTIESFTVKGGAFHRVFNTDTYYSIAVPLSLDGYEYEDFHVDDGKFVMSPKK